MKEAKLTSQQSCSWRYLAVLLTVFVYYRTYLFQDRKFRMYFLKYSCFNYKWFREYQILYWGYPYIILDYFDLKLNLRPSWYQIWRIYEKYENIKWGGQLYFQYIQELESKGKKIIHKLEFGIGVSTIKNGLLRYALILDKFFKHC